MKIFIDIGHPAHVHYFKNLIRKLSAKGHSFVVTARDKEMAHYLLKCLDIDFINRGKGADGVIGKALYLIQADFKLLKVALKEKPDLFLSFGSPYCAQVAKIMGKDHIVIDDTENASMGQLLYLPFSECVLTPDCFEKDFGSKQIRFPSYMELSYLHPNIFEPDKTVLDDLGIKPQHKYIVTRFVNWGAVHDIGHKGVSDANKIKAVNEFSKFGKVFVSSEGKLPDEISEYKINLPPEKMHDVLAFASLFYGESATMASESAILGTPAIYLDDEGRGYTRDQEQKYGLVYNYSESEEDQIRSIQKGTEVLKSSTKIEWQEKRERLLSEKIDLTAFFTWFIENYPLSKNSLRENSSLMEKFA